MKLKGNTLGRAVQARLDPEVSHAAHLKAAPAFQNVPLRTPVLCPGGELEWLLPLGPGCLHGACLHVSRFGPSEPDPPPPSPHPRIHSLHSRVPPAEGESPAKPAVLRRRHRTLRSAACLVPPAPRSGHTLRSGSFSRRYPGKLCDTPESRSIFLRWNRGHAYVII
ncbi:hypothetical protein AAFF_G00077580 [Aldrovandia affinis]|uniref:Uncharacterized protein n=1 Tax=Aldrovandia affinis TaxID=143900 RepID=A0AAD7WD47_9TELE|nr:hypothetical protein AAFF_G00077580 [Aldrovandia affinis]